MKRLHLPFLVIISIFFLILSLKEGDDLFFTQKLEWDIKDDSVYKYFVSYKALGKTSVNGMIANNSISSNNSSWEDINTELEGYFSLQVVQKDKKCPKLLYKWESVKGFVKNGDKMIWDAKKDTSTNDFYFSMCKNGEFKDLAFNESSGLISRGIYKTLLSLYQLSFPVKSKRKWSKEESYVDHVGVAEYEILDSENNEHLSINKTVKSKSDAFNTNGDFIVRFSLDHSAVSYIKGTRKKETFFESTKVALEDVSFELKMLSVHKKEKTSSIASSRSGKKYMFVTNGLSAKEEFKVLKKRQQMELVKNVTSYELLENLESNPKDFKTMEMLEALLLTRPEEADRVASALSVANYNERYFHKLAALLSRTGTVESQNALIEVMKAKEGVKDKSFLYLVPYLGHSKNPTKASENYLYEIAEGSAVKPSIARTAELGLGTIGRTLNENNYSRSTDILNVFSKKLENAFNIREEEHYLRVLGNLGHESQIKILKRYIDENHQLKKTALNALRNIGTDEAIEILVSTIDNSKNQEERLVSLESLSYADLNPISLDLYRKVLKNEKDLLVVSSTIDNLNAKAAKNDSARRLLIEFKKICPTSELCNKVQG